ncbi:P-loop containing nucleoside triphosphate hydrolase protein, partial [Mycena capillaripes]
WALCAEFIITGDAAVGKSSLLVRLTDQRFLANPDPTVRVLDTCNTLIIYSLTHLGVEFGSKLITIPGPEATAVKLQCWDTAATESFRSITRSCQLSGATGVCLVFSLLLLCNVHLLTLARTQAASSATTSHLIRSWLADVRARADAHVSCTWVENMANLWEGKVNARPHRARRAVRSQRGSPLHRSSARSGLRVEEAFVRAAEEVLGKVRAGRFDDEGVRVVSLLGGFWRVFSVSSLRLWF